MKKQLLFLLLFPLLALAQSQDQNYIKATVYKDSTSQTTKKNIQVIYFDGLGRPIQKVDSAQSNSGKDIVTHIEYDAYGRQTKDFLPFVSSTASSLNIKTNETATFYGSNNISLTGNPNFETTSNPYSEKQLESSPLNRVLKQAAPGNPWAMGSGKEIKFDYQTNTNADQVKLFTVTTSWNLSYQLYGISIANLSYYTDNQLYKTITKDENWTSGTDNTTEEFKDKEGRVVLKRTYGTSIKNGSPINEKHDTYYVYDIYGNLTYVIPPLADGAFDQQTLDGLCYQYRYDSRNRLAAKKLPGKQWEFIVYDKLDRPVATGPALTPYGGKAVGMMITEYDAFGRVTQTGWRAMTVDESSRGSWQTSINGGSNPFILGTNDILTKNYYDNYTYPGAPTVSSPYKAKPKGLQTGSWVKILDPLNPNLSESSYTLYDHKFRPIRTRTTNYLGGHTQIDTSLDWAGKTLSTTTRHKRTSGDVELVVTDNFTYTAQDRLSIHTQTINGTTQLIAKNTYDELGQLISKNVGGTDVTGAQGLQKVDYSYNIRGWLKTINNVDNLTDGMKTDLFAFKINYNDNLTSNLSTGETAVKQLFNGNISETFWTTAADYQKRKYGYTYDELNRLTSAVFQNKTIPAEINAFNEALSYDKNGNIKGLIRYKLIPAPQYKDKIDDLFYDYHSINKNQLIKVSEINNINSAGFKDGNTSGDDYGYDANGNMTVDKNKSIGLSPSTEITYNHLNLPVKIIFLTGNIEYLYNATGQKVKKTVTVSGVPTITDYLGGFQYKANVLEFFPHAEGYVKNASGVLSYVFNYTDHLGNVRVSYTQNGSSLQILEESNYYPFGLKHQGYNEPNNPPNYKYKYNSKEYQDELGLNITAMDWRQYDGAIGRFNGIDVLAELMPSITPNNFAFNNPLFWSDPSGLISQAFIDSIWQNSHGSSTTWTNDGTGLFSNGQKRHIDENGKYFETTADEHLATVQLYRGLGDQRNAGITEAHLYNTGKYYQGLRDRRFSGQLDDLQSGLDVLGTFDPTGLIDGLNALGYLARGQRGNAAIAAIAILPFGDLAKGTKLADKAHTVYTGVKDGLPYVGITSDLSKRYTADEMQKYGIQRLLNNVPGRDMARGIEQNLINHRGLENMANKINSISPANQKGKHSATMERATQYLNNNLPGWNN